MIQNQLTNEPVINSRLNKTLTDKWILVFNIPEPLKKLKDIGTDNDINNDSVQLSLIGVNIPSVEVRAVPVRYASDTIHVSSHNKEPYTLLSIKFEINNDYSNYKTIYSWLNLLHDEKFAIPDAHDLIDKKFVLQDFVSNMILVGLDEYNIPQIKYTFLAAFPTYLQGINFNYRDDKSIEIEVRFAFSQMHMELPDNKKPFVS